LGSSQLRQEGPVFIELCDWQFSDWHHVSSAALGKRQREAFMWKVKRTEGRDRIVLSLIGHVQSEHVNELRQVFVSEAATHDLILDLKDLKLVDQDVVSFLANCEASGATLRNCPAYVREWIRAERTEQRVGL
jgi:hypothetical protein